MDYAVKFEGVYKEYPYYQHITAGLKSFIFNLPKNIKTLKKSRFVALNDVSFEVRKGETFGIIGRNGSGKSTILSLMAGVIRQDRGFMETNGRISSLLELGAGFHPDLSGLENIILNGILMGHTKEEVMGKIDRIKEFSELGDFIYQPLRTYSSGMHVRLGFSVAVHIDPEILLVDEALAVGDMSFQEKCMDRMLEFRESGATIVIVSHDMMSISKLCDRAAWIDGGRIMAIGKPNDVVMKYIEHFEHREGQPAAKDRRSAEAEIKSETDEVVVHRDDLHEVKESEDTQEQVDISETKKPSSWWDSLVVAAECEALITGDPKISFYEFLKKQYMIGSLKRGLGICNRLRGIEVNYVINSICKPFDVIDNEDEIARLTAGEWNFKEKYYELFLCVDLLHRMKDIDLFLKHVDGALGDKGYIIAMEYVGPVNFQWSDKEIKIADMIYAAIGSRDGSDDSGGIMKSAALSRAGKNMTGGVSSEEVIPMIGKHFDVLSIRYIGGPLFDLLLDRVIESLDPDDKKDSALIRTIIRFEQALIGEGVLGNNYAVIIAKKRHG